MILGESGSGKSASLRNFEPGEIGIFNVAGKPLPFKKKLPSKNTDEYAKIMSGLLGGKCKSFAIDDSQYLMCFEMFSKSAEVGYQKFTDIRYAATSAYGHKGISHIHIWICRNQIYSREIKVWRKHK